MKRIEVVTRFVGRIFLSILALLIILFYLDVPFELGRPVSVILLLYIGFYSLLLLLHSVFVSMRLPFIMLFNLDIVFALIFIYSTGLIYSPFIFLLFLVPLSTSSMKWLWGTIINVMLFSIFIVLCYYYNKFTIENRLPPLVDEKFWHRFQGTTSTMSIMVLLFSLLLIDFLLRRLHRLSSYSSMKKTLILSNIPMAIGFYSLDGSLMEASEYFIKNNFDNPTMRSLIKEISYGSYVSMPMITSFLKDGKNYELSIYPLNYSNKKTNELMVLVKEILSTRNSINVFDKFSLKEILHEIKNPLTVIRTAIQSMKEDKHISNIVTSEIEQIKNFIDTFEDKEFEKEKLCQFFDCFSEMLDIYRYQFEEKKIAIDYFIPKEVVINIPHNHLKHILHNVFSNIAKYTTINTVVYCVGYIEYNIEKDIKKFKVRFKNQTEETSIKNGSGLKIIQTLLENYGGELKFTISNGIAITEILV